MFNYLKNNRFHIINEKLKNLQKLTTILFKFKYGIQKFSKRLKYLIYSEQKIEEKKRMLK